MIDYYHPNIELTLSGCGFLGPYHVGAIHLLEQIWPHRPFERISGASCGGLIATLYCCGFDTAFILRQFASVAAQFRAFLKNPTHQPRMQQHIESALECLPVDAHERCSGRLGLSLTKASTWENKFVTQFKSRQDLIDACGASCFIPIWSGAFKCRPYNQENYVDGAYSDNSPAFPPSNHDEGSKVRYIHLQALSSEIQVSPKDDFYWIRLQFVGALYHINWRNVVRTKHAMIAGPLETYRDYLLSGHQEMKNHILGSDFIRCKDCYSAKTVAEMKGPCLLCLRLLERVDSLQVSEEVLSILS